jgi:hypothetical protein
MSESFPGASAAALRCILRIRHPRQDAEMNGEKSVLNVPPKVDSGNKIAAAAGVRLDIAG